MKRGLLKRRLCRSFLFKWTKDRGNEPQRPKEEYPWFWDGGTFKGDRVNDRHYTNAEKQAARERLKHKASTKG